MTIPQSYMLRWEINTDCNLACKHCCNADSSALKRGTPLSGEQITGAISRLSGQGLRRIHFLGGEPLVREDFFDVCDCCVAHAIDVSFNTNALMLNDSGVLKRTLSIPFGSITISIDGTDSDSHDYIRGPGTFDAVIQAVKSLVTARNEQGLQYPHIVIQSTLTKLWHTKITDLFVLAEELGAIGIVINNLALEGRAKQYSGELSLTGNEEFQAAGAILKNMFEHPHLMVKSPFRSLVAQYYRSACNLDLPGILFDCNGGINVAYVFPDGRVSPCIIAEIQGMGKPFLPINIQASDTDSLWNSSYFKHFRSIVHGPLETTYEHITPCNQCAFLGTLCKPCPLSLSSGPGADITPCSMALEKMASVSNKATCCYGT